MLSHAKNLERLQQGGLKDVYNITKNLRKERNPEKLRKKIEKWKQQRQQWVQNEY